MMNDVIEPEAQMGDEPEAELTGDEPVAELTDDRWLRAFYAAQRPGMVRLAYVLVDDHETAEDVVQNAFTKMYSARGRVDNPTAYLRSAVYNACRNHHRRARVRWARPMRPDPTADVPVGDHVIDVVRRLPAKRRAMVVLRYYAGLTDQEIAATLRVPLGTVKSTLHRTLQQLREDLS